MTQDSPRSSLPVLAPDALFSVEGRRILLTGASSGLGERFARTLVASGAKVVLVARRRDRLVELARELGSCQVFSADLSNDEETRGLMEFVEGSGGVDGLVNNAGMSGVSPAEEEDISAFRRVVEVNLNAVFHLSALVGQAALHHSRKLSIVNIASVLGHVASGQIPQASYAASKAGVVNLTRELSAQWGRRGIRVNALCPGWFPSEMTELMFDNPSSIAWISKRTPMGRPGITGELDGALIYLLSDASSYMTGQSIIIDGGWSII